MRKLILIIALLFLPISVFAQEDTTISAKESKYFDLKLTQISQSPINKSIKYRLEITPLMNAQKTQILWEVPVSFSFNPKHSEFVSLSVGQTYTYDMILSPKREGIYEVTATVTAWEFDTNYTNTVSQTLTLNSSLVSQPITSDYQVGVILLTVLILLLSGAAIGGSIKITKRLMQKTRKWLTPPS